jgi:hypothetical protein
MIIDIIGEQQVPPTSQAEGEAGESEGEEGPENPQEGEGGVNQEKGYPTPTTTTLEKIRSHGATFIKRNPPNEDIRETLIKIGTKYEYLSGKISRKNIVTDFEEINSDISREGYFQVIVEALDESVGDSDDGGSEETTDEEDEDDDTSRITFQYFYDTQFNKPGFNIINEVPTKITPTSPAVPRPPITPVGPNPRPLRESPQLPGDTTPRPFPHPQPRKQDVTQSVPITPSNPTADVGQGVAAESVNDPQGGGRRLRRKKRTNKKRRSVRKNISSKRRTRKRRTQKRRTQKRRTQKKRTRKKRNVNMRY